MTGRQLTTLLRALRWDAEDEQRIAFALLKAKIDVYEDTLEELADQHGYDVDGDGVELSPAIVDALELEAEAAAASIVDTYNAEVEAFVRARREQEVDMVLEQVETWQDERATAKQRVIAITESHTPHADATMAFYADNGLEPVFDFGGHGDAAPKCELCQALAEASPHPLARVLAIGNPHPQCEQKWHAVDVDEGDLPDELVLGSADVAGIVGRAESLVQRAGGTKAAADQVRAME